MVTTEQIIEKLRTQHVLFILDQNRIPYKDELNQNHIKCKTVCHGGSSFKLCYFKEDKYFYCYTNCGSISIFQLLMDINDWTFMKSLIYVADIVGETITHNKPKRFEKSKKTINDWDFINKYNKMKTKNKKDYEFITYNKTILNVFDKIYPSSWEQEGISTQAMSKFNICFHTNEFATIIPHFSIKGDLIGIRSRHHLAYREEKGSKYMPTFIEGKMYNHPLQFNLYGSFENKENIRKHKKAILFESEKAVLQCESYYPKNNFSVALCGSNMSVAQRDVLLYELNISEIIIALDKQYKDVESDEHELYIKKVKKIADKFVNYVDVYIIYCTDDRLDYKSSPSDHGKEALESLMKEKIRYYNNEGE